MQQSCTLCSKSWLKLWASGAYAHSACCLWLCQWPAEGVGRSQDIPGYAGTISQGPSLATEEHVHSSCKHSVCRVSHFHSRGLGAWVGGANVKGGVGWSQVPSVTSSGGFGNLMSDEAVVPRMGHNESQKDTFTPLGSLTPVPTRPSFRPLDPGPIVR